jgi:outer membrane protein OmpA-like peptidoglycan-associated protein
MQFRSNGLKFTMAAAALAVLASCTTVDPYTGEQRTARSATFGAAGAVVCGLIGAAENSQRARNAALGCGAIGAGIGAYMDAQEAELREELEGTGVRVRRDGDELELIMPGSITFPVDGYQIREDFQPVLGAVAEVLYKFTDTRLQVTGHTDSTGARDYNYGLSERRANSVANYLASQGVNQERLITQGMGPDEPIASNETAAGRAENRRVELRIVAIPDQAG